MTNCLAGKFEGNVDVTGTLTAAVKNFRIDDPIGCNGAVPIITGYKKGPLILDLGGGPSSAGERAPSGDQSV